MSYELSIEHLEESARRAAADRIDRAIEALGATDGDAAEHIHDARTALKRARTVARLVRDEIGEAAFRRDDQALRDAGRALSHARDASVTTASLEALLKRFPGDREALAPAAAALGERRAQSLADHALDEARRAEIRRGLVEVRERLGSWKLRPRGWKVIEGGVARAYRQGRRCFRRAAEVDVAAGAGVVGGDAPAWAEPFHDLRKRVKDLTYQARLLRPLWPTLMRAEEDALEALGDDLGELHDLAVLDDLARRHPDALGGAEVAGRLLALVDLRAAKIRASIRPAAARVFAERPRDRARRLKACFRAALAEATAKAAAKEAEQRAGEAL